MIRRSCTRTLSIMSRMFLTRRSNCLGISLNKRKCSPSAAIFSCVSGCARPFFSIATVDSSYKRRNSSKCSRASSGSGPVSTSSSSSPSSSSFSPSSSASCSSVNSEPTCVAAGAMSSSSGLRKPEMMSLKRISSASYWSHWSNR